MTDEISQHQISDPDIFSRGSLQLTYDLIRPSNAQLALSVRNIVGGAPLPKDASQQDNPHSDHFKVHLDSFQVRHIVEELMQRLQQSAINGTNPGQMIIAKALVEEWVSLARKMVADLPPEEAPP
ncbi:MAG: hypothetical protein COA99_13720 [Moraxellaceae bacterium]|nr:MAG: hypothetical protein COA99_13720 [Moraxellaceae bacterium]